MTSFKKLDIDQLIGKIIVSYTLEHEKRLLLVCSDGARYAIEVDDDGCGCNDSLATIVECDLRAVETLPITAAWATSVTDDEVLLTLEHADDIEGGTRSFIRIVHEHNGYYGFSYEVVPLDP